MASTTAQSVPTSMVIGTQQSQQPIVIRSNQQTSSKAVTTLAITQIWVSALLLGFGICARIVDDKSNWVLSVDGATWGGVWMLITGTIGCCGYYFSENGVWKRFYIAFCVIAAVIAFFDCIIFAIALVNNKVVGKAIYGISTIAMAVEFFVAIVAAVYLCRCCRSSSPGVVMQQQPHGGTIVVSSISSNTEITMSQPQKAYPVQMSIPNQACRYYPGNTNLAYSTGYMEQQKQQQHNL